MHLDVTPRPQETHHVLPAGTGTLRAADPLLPARLHED